MNKRIGFAAAAVAGTVIALTGCTKGSGHPAASAKASSAAAAIESNPATAQAQKLIQTCVAKTGFITKADREALMACIAHGGSKAKVEACIQKAVSADGLLLTKADRVKFEQTDAPECVVNNG